MHDYNPQRSYDIGKSSGVFKNNGSTIIGKNTLDYINFTNYHKEKSQVPGPGQYRAFSEFGQVIE